MLADGRSCFPCSPWGSGFAFEGLGWAVITSLAEVPSLCLSSCFQPLLPQGQWSHAGGQEEATELPCEGGTGRGKKRAGTLGAAGHPKL